EGVAETEAVGVGPAQAASDVSDESSLPGLEKPPEVESPLPDVLVYFRPVARRRVSPPGAAPGAPPANGETAQAPPPWELEGGEAPAAGAPEEAASEGEPASRGRRRRRRGDRGDRSVGSVPEREDTHSGVGGSLPPRSERTERPAAELTEEVAEPATEVPV